MTTGPNFQNYFSMVSRAQALIEIERWGDAIKLLDKGLSAYPDNHWILCSLALSHFSLGNNDCGMEYANRAVNVAPEEEWGHRLRSVILLRQKKNGEALKAAREAVRVAPESSTALYVFTQAMIANKRLDEARDMAEKLRQSAPESDITHEALGNVALEKQHWVEAEGHFEAALRINPQSYEAMNNLGVALLNQGRDKEATERFHQAAAINPMDEVARANLKASIIKFLPLTGAALLLLIKAFALKAAPFVGWITLHTSRLFFSGGDSVSWGAVFGGLLALGLTIFYLAMLISGIYSLRSSRFKDLPERLQSYIHLERSRALRGFGWRAIGGLSLVVVLWWGLLWRGSPDSEYAPQTITSWLILIALCATTIASGVQLWRNRRRS